MNKLRAISITSIAAIGMPILTNAITYDESGAALLGSEQVPESSSLYAAVAGSNMSLTCIATVVLMLVTMYIFHELWHPQRKHESMTRDEIKRGSVRFYIGGSVVWMMIAILAEAWCVILPLALILAAAIIYYLIVISMTQEEQADIN